MDEEQLTPEDPDLGIQNDIEPDGETPEGGVQVPEVDPSDADSGKIGSGTTLSLSGMFREYWIDYASDVILDRSVPDIDDGLKPVQRRILHAMKETDDGRFTKVANIVGTTMLYHPHGDASINDALVNMGQKNLLIDCQGNWGNILTGDGAAAGRYIEARLSKFAKEVVFNAKTTQWKPSYDGRKQEPVTLPIKFPLLLAQGTKGIAVTLTSNILPYNFCELLEASGVGYHLLRNPRTLFFCSVDEAVSGLYERGVQSLLVEGGADVLQSFIDLGLWDEAYVETGVCKAGEGVAAPRLSDEWLTGETLVGGHVVRSFRRG